MINDVEYFRELREDKITELVMVYDQTGQEPCKIDLDAIDLLDNKILEMTKKHGLRQSKKH